MKIISVNGQPYNACEISNKRLDTLLGREVKIDGTREEVENPYPKWYTWRLRWTQKGVEEKVRAALCRGGDVEVLPWGENGHCIYVMTEVGEEYRWENVLYKDEVYVNFTDEDVLIGDPCYLKKSKSNKKNLERIKLVPGRWHCRQIVRRTGGRATKVIMYHDDVDPCDLIFYEDQASHGDETFVGIVGIDSGEVAVAHAHTAHLWTTAKRLSWNQDMFIQGFYYDSEHGAFVTETENGDGEAKINGIPTEAGMYKALFIYLP